MVANETPANQLHVHHGEVFRSIKPSAYVFLDRAAVNGLSGKPGRCLPLRPSIHLCTEKCSSL